MSADDQLRDANWARMRTAITDAASDYRKLADELERIPFENSRGRRTPEAIISEAALSSGNNIAAQMLHRMAGWAESINEIERYAAREATSSRVLCPVVKTFGDDTWTCVLSSGHSGPDRKGVLAHMTASGAEFYA